MRVGLVPDVPQDLVARGLQHRVQRDGELAGAEVGAEVPADLTNRVDDVLADLLRDLDQLRLAQLVQVRRTIDAIEQPWLGPLAHEVRV